MIQAWEKFGFLGLTMTLMLDRKNKISRLEDLVMFNPFEKRTISKCKENIKNIDFSVQLYPDNVMRELVSAVVEQRSIRPPRMMFIPTR